MMLLEDTYERRSRLRRAIEDIQELVSRHGFTAIQINQRHVVILDGEGDDCGSAMEAQQAAEVLS